MKVYFESITGTRHRVTSLHGGDINEVYKIEAKNGSFVLKTNRKNYPRMFPEEAAGLKALGGAGLPVPEVIAVQEDAILLKYIEQGRPNMQQAGEYLGRLHSIHQNNFGFESDNYIGSLPQPNTIESRWSDFIIKHRLQFQIDLYFKNRHADAASKKVWQKLFQKIPDLMSHNPSAALLHGDLWSGNLYHGKDGPVFIDPAVYRGDPLIELAFTELFGSFGASFYDAYRAQHPIDPVYKDLKPFYQIYPLLVHANLFGGGYYSSALRNARHYTG